MNAMAQVANKFERRNQGDNFGTFMSRGQWTIHLIEVEFIFLPGDGLAHAVQYLSCFTRYKVCALQCFYRLSASQAQHCRGADTKFSRSERRQQRGAERKQGFQRGAERLGRCLCGSRTEMKGGGGGQSPKVLLYRTQWVASSNPLFTYLIDEVEVEVEYLSPKTQTRPISYSCHGLDINSSDGEGECIIKYDESWCWNSFLMRRSQLLKASIAYVQDIMIHAVLYIDTWIHRLQVFSSATK